MKTFKALVKVSLILSLFNFNNVYATDIYKYCQVTLDSVRSMSTLPINELMFFKKSIALADSLEDIHKITSKDFSSMVPILQDYQNISKEEAEKETLEVIKFAEIESINRAIRFNGMKDERIWSLLFDKCVTDSTL
jgi:hypothetical protein